MLTRRALLASPAALAACASDQAGAQAQLPTMFARAELQRAVNAMGGAAVIEARPVLAWTGSARIHQGDDVIEIGVDTIVEPFIYARSRTWLLSQGPEQSRALEIDGDQGWMLRGDTRSPMPAPMLRHERQQYAIYGLMRLITLLRDNVQVESANLPADAPPIWNSAVLAQHPLAPPTLLIFDRNPYLVAAENIVASPEEGGTPIHQRFHFRDHRRGQGPIVWPRAMRIDWDGRPFFELTLDTFTPRQSR